MSGGPDRDQALVMVAALLGAVAQALAGLGTIVLAPAALVAAITAVAGANQIRRDLDAAALRFGVALLASAVVTLFTLLSGVTALIAVTVVSNGVFAFALVRTRRMASVAHDHWGRVHRERARRQAQLQRRRDDQVMPSAPARQAPTAPPPRSTVQRAPSPSEHEFEVEDDTAWWDDLE